MLRKKIRDAPTSGEHFHFVGDVGAGFAEAVISPSEGYGAFNLRGITVHTEEFIRTIQQVGGELNT